MALVQQHLGRDVLGRPAECVGARTGLDDLRETEIGEFGVSVGQHEQVFGFEIAVDDVQRVDVLERLRDVSGVELGKS